MWYVRFLQNVVMTSWRQDVMTYDVMLTLELIGDQNPTSWRKFEELSCKLSELENLILKLRDVIASWCHDVRRRSTDVFCRHHRRLCPQKIWRKNIKKWRNWTQKKLTSLGCELFQCRKRYISGFGYLPKQFRHSDTTFGHSYFSILGGEFFFFELGDQILRPLNFGGGTPDTPSSQQTPT
jgi:hypothetical protein